MEGVPVLIYFLCVLIVFMSAMTTISSLLTLLTRIGIPILIVVSLLIYLGAHLAGQVSVIYPLLVIPIVIGLIPLAREMVVSIMRRHFGVDVIALLAISSAALAGEYIAALVVLLMLSGGEALEHFALRRARKELTHLLDNAPQTAHLKRDGQIIDVLIDSVAVGDIVIVKPGEVIPVDGKIVSGISEVDESALTGEAIYVEKVPNSRVLSGSVNIHAVLEVYTDRSSKESHYAKIIQLVREAEQSKAPFVRLADRYSVWFTGIAIGLALVSWITTGEMVRAIAVLVVATPCPLILATPIAFASGISRAAKRGVIIKHAEAIEKLAHARGFMFDKTGTITFGTPRLVKIVTFQQRDESEVLHIAASLDQLSNHILARAILAHARYVKVDKLVIPDTFEETLGAGVHGKIRGRDYYLGRLSYLTEQGVVIPPDIQHDREKTRSEGIIMVYLAGTEGPVAVFEFADTTRAPVKRLFTHLRSLGARITMLTGDKRVVAEHIGQQAGVDETIAECLPEDKVEYVRREREQRKPVVMVGDGVNDAPALAIADVGIAMGAHGSSAASESGDIVVMVDAVERVGEIYDLSRRVLMIATQSIFIGIGLSILLMVVAALGYIPPVYGAMMQEVIDVLVILNALRVHSGKVSMW